MPTTNATTNSQNLVAMLAQSKHGSFTGLVIRKEGTVRGRGPNKKLYGDDLVHVCGGTGFNYTTLVRKSLAKLNELDLDSVYGRVACLTDKDGHRVSRTAFDHAVIELRESLQSSIDGTNSSTTDHVYEPLVLTQDDGTREVVRGARVYVGNPSGEDAAEPGTVYLQGLQISSTVIERAANGSAPQTQSSAVVVAKNALRKLLPISRYVSYKLAVGQSWILRAGASAALAADDLGIQIRDADVTEVFSLAQ